MYDWIAWELVKMHLLSLVQVDNSEERSQKAFHTSTAIGVRKIGGGIQKIPSLPLKSKHGAHGTQPLSRLCKPTEQVYTTALFGAHRDWRSDFRHQKYTIFGRYDVVRFVCAVRLADDSSVLTPRGWITLFF